MSNVIAKWEATGDVENYKVGGKLSKFDEAEYEEITDLLENQNYSRVNNIR